MVAGARLAAQGCKLQDLQLPARDLARREVVEGMAGFRGKAHRLALGLKWLRHQAAVTEVWVGAPVRVRVAMLWEMELATAKAAQVPELRTQLEQGGHVELQADLAEQADPAPDQSLVEALPREMARWRQQQARVPLTDRRMDRVQMGSTSVEVDDPSQQIFRALAHLF